MSSLGETDDMGELSQRLCVNVGTAVIPAFGCVRVVGCDTSGVLAVDIPNQDSQDVLVNGPIPIQPGGQGSVTADDPLYVAYSAGDGTPAFGDQWGAAAGSYLLRKNNGQTGWNIYGGVIDNRCYARRSLLGQVNSFTANLLANTTIAASLDDALDWDDSVPSTTPNYTFPTSGDDTQITYTGSNTNLVLCTINLQVDSGLPGSTGMKGQVYLAKNGAPVASATENICGCSGDSAFTVNLYLDETNKLAAGDVLTVHVSNSDSTYAWRVFQSGTVVKFYDFPGAFNQQHSP